MTKLFKVVKDSGIKVTILCSKVGVTYPIMMNVIKGYTPLSPELTLRLADYFGVEPSEITGDVVEKKERAMA
jgi:plasmid maintenance system antidote protein VapI